MRVDTRQVGPLCSLLFCLGLGTLVGCGDPATSPGPAVSTPDESPTMHLVEPTHSSVDVTLPSQSAVVVKDDALSELVPLTVPNTYDPPPTMCRHGAIRGRLCSPRGDRWAEGAHVSVVSTQTCGGDPHRVDAWTDEQGYYYLPDVPSGEHTILIETGSFIREIKRVRVRAGEVTDLTDMLGKLYTCWSHGPANIAVLSGMYDGIENMLDAKGLEYSFYAGDAALDMDVPDEHSGLSLLSAEDPSALLEYQLLVINSGEWHRFFGDPTRALEREQIRRNLHAFVQSGGSIIATDWAQPWIEEMWPDRVEFYGDHDKSLGSWVGPRDTLQAEVVDYGWQMILVQHHSDPPVKNINLAFDDAGWTLIRSVQRGMTDVLIEAPSVATVHGELLENVPLLVSFRPSPTSGLVVYSSFSWRDQPELMGRAIEYLIFRL